MFLSRLFFGSPKEPSKTPMPSEPQETKESAPATLNQTPLRIDDVVRYVTGRTVGCKVKEADDGSNEIYFSEFPEEKEIKPFVTFLIPKDEKINPRADLGAPYINSHRGLPYAAIDLRSITSRFMYSIHEHVAKRLHVNGITQAELHIYSGFLDRNPKHSTNCGCELIIDGKFESKQEAELQEFLQKSGLSLSRVKEQHPQIKGLEFFVHVVNKEPFFNDLLRPIARELGLSIKEISTPASSASAASAGGSSSEADLAKKGPPGGPSIR